MTSEDTPRGSRVPRWVRWPLLLLWIAVLALICARLALPGVVNRWVTGLMSEQLNLDLTIQDIEIDLLDGYVILSGIEAEVDGQHLASIREAEARLDVRQVVFDARGTIAILFHGLTGDVHVEEGGGINLGRIGPPAHAPKSPPQPSPPPADAARLYLDLQAADATITIHDPVSDPAHPLTVQMYSTTLHATRVRVTGPELGADLMDVRLLAAVGERDAPALIAAGFWTGKDPDGTYLELHAAITGIDIRGIPQWVTPKAGTILGGDVLHASATGIAHKGQIDEGLIELDVEGTNSDLELRFGGPLDAPVFDMGSPVLQAFRLSYLRVVDGGSGLFSRGRSFGTSLWDRTSGVFTHTAGGVSDAVTQLSLRRLGEGVWDGISGLFKRDNADESEARREKWGRWAQRQLEFRKLFTERRLEVAKQREPSRVPHFQRDLENAKWKKSVYALVPKSDAASPPQDDD